MCFAKIEWVTDDNSQLLKAVGEHIRAVFPFHEYSRGCHLISIAGARILIEYGVQCKPELVALWKASMSMWIPHYVIRGSGGDTIDLKRRLFGRMVNGRNVQAAPDIPPKPMGDGYYPEGRRFLKEPSLETFVLDHYKREFLRFRVCRTEEQLSGTCRSMVQAAVESFKF